MINLLTNVPQFNNDISEEIRLFLGLVDISFSEETVSEMVCRVILNSDSAICELLPHNVKVSVPYTSASDPLEDKRRKKRAVKLAVYNAMKQCFHTKTPWGALTGIRPTKLYRELVVKNSFDYADSQFRDTFFVSEDKLQLVKAIHKVQAPIINSAAANEFDVYLGIPYCKTRCIYCSFGSELCKNANQLREYVDHLKEEISGSANIVKEFGYKLRCCYFGGGTPTVLTEDLLDELLDYTVSKYQGLGSEFTVEAGRPDTITKEKLLVLKKYYISRISINPQTMNADTLRIIGRSHTPDSINYCFKMARDLGFDNINMDVIAGLPGEDLSAFNNTLSRISELCPDNLTVHTLALKKSSLLIDKLDDYPLPTPDETEKMVMLGTRYASDMGMLPYYMYRQKYMSGNLENVGYSKPDKECVYNIDMMEETVSVMAHGAHTITKRIYADENRVERIANPKDVPSYFAKIPAIIDTKRTAFSLTSK